MARGLPSFCFGCLQPQRSEADRCNQGRDVVHGALLGFGQKLCLWAAVVWRVGPAKATEVPNVPWMDQTNKCLGREEVGESSWFVDVGK